LSEEVLKRLEDLARRLERLEGRVSPPQHEHKFGSLKDGSGVFCIDCGERYYRLDGFEDVLKRLREHHGEGDFLSCPSCRPKFLSLVKDLGYEVRDDGRRIEIRRKR